MVFAMVQPKKQLPVKQTRRDEIFNILVDFASSHKGNSPSGRELWRQVMSMRRKKMAYGVFQKHMKKLTEEGRIQRVDGEIVIPDSDWNFRGGV